MYRSQLINRLIEYFDYKTYLEIGVCNPTHNFNLIKSGYKIGIDPNPQANATFCMTSDEFFNFNSQRFDIIFIDGLHHAEQVYKDAINSLQILNENGTIVCHDMNPKGYREQLVPRVTRHWNGDCWRAWVKLRSRSDLAMFVLDFDEGCGIIRKGEQKPLNIELNYDEFANNKIKYLPLHPENYLEAWLILQTLPQNVRQ